MPANNAGIEVGYLCGKYPGKLGWLLGPGGWKRVPTWMPYALDNGAFPAWINNRKWDESEFCDLVESAKRYHPPLWVVVPDVVADRDATIASWDVWYPRLKSSRPSWKYAFAVQDGMTVKDVPKSADVVFVGGTTEWKWRHLMTWTSSFPRVHVGRVNSERLLWMAHDAGAESCDGTGWLRGDQNQLDGLRRYLEMSTTNGRKQLILEWLT